MDLYIKKFDVSTTIYETAVLASLNYYLLGKNKSVYISVYQIGYLLTGKFINKTKDKCLFNNIKKGLDSLVKNKFITQKSNSGDDYVFDLSNIIINKNKDKDQNKDKFIMIDLEEVHTIFNSDKVDRPFMLFDFFVRLIGKVNNKTKEWHMSQQEMVDCFNVGSFDTISSYLDILQELKLIYLFKPNRHRTDGTYHNIVNSYGRYKDKDKVIFAAKEYLSTVDTKENFKKLNRGAIRQRFNAFDNGGKKYLNDKNLVIALYQECVEYNNSLSLRPIEDKANEFKPRDIIDLSRFDAYITNPIDKCKDNVTMMQFAPISAKDEAREHFLKLDIEQANEDYIPDVEYNNYSVEDDIDW